MTYYYDLDADLDLCEDYLRNNRQVNSHNPNAYVMLYEFLAERQRPGQQLVLEVKGRDDDVILITHASTSEVLYSDEGTVCDSFG